MYQDTTAVILAGGQGQRLGGKDKGLLLYKGQKLVESAIETLNPHYDRIIISANRHHEIYTQYGYPVVADNAYQQHSIYKGPLAGIEAAMQQSISRDYLMVYACDIVNIPDALFTRLHEQKTRADIVVASDLQRKQYLLSIWKTRLLDDIQQSINNDELAVHKFLHQHHTEYVNFEDAEWININNPKWLS